MPRWAVFNVVGMLGFGVQLLALAAFLHAGVPYLTATACAVELAVLHNYIWHERWTWRERRAAGRARLGRLARFHLLNGVTSIAGNVAMMWLLVSAYRMRPMTANTISVLVLAAVNYWWGDRVVFVDAAV